MGPYIVKRNLHSIFLHLRAPDEAAALNREKHFENKFLILSKNDLMQVVEKDMCICFVHVAVWVLNLGQLRTWLEQNVLLTGGCGLAQCLRGPWLSPSCPGCTRWPTGCLKSTRSQTTIDESTLSKVCSSTAAKALTMHRRPVEGGKQKFHPCHLGLISMEIFTASSCRDKLINHLQAKIASSWAILCFKSYSKSTVDKNHHHRDHCLRLPFIILSVDLRP